MIYFDNAATTWPKPPAVLEAMHKYMQQVGANPGRSGHKMAIQANRIVTEAREYLNSMFNASGPQGVIFTLNCTDALNMAIKGLLKEGDHVVTSSMEHNSVARPLHGLMGRGVDVTKVPCSQDGSIRVADVRAALRENTKAIIMLHASNVTGTIMPIQEIGALAREKKIIFIVDAAQTAGVLDIDMKRMQIDILALPGHKGLLGPPGTGVLILGEGVDLEPLREGGTGSHSLNAGQPDVLPEKLESGTLNTVGIAGLLAGVKWLLATGLERVRKHEENLLQRFLSGAQKVKGLKIYGPNEVSRQVPVVSFALEGKKSVDVGGTLDKYFNIACRAGLHCAPDAHRTLGTLEQQLVRFSFSFFNTLEEVDRAVEALQEISTRELQPASGCGC